MLTLLDFRNHIIFYPVENEKKHNIIKYFKLSYS